MSDIPMQMSEEDYIDSPIDTPGGLNQGPDEEEISGFIDTIVQKIDTDERATRDFNLRLWKYLDLLWSGSGNFYWDSVTNQYRAITSEDIASLSREADIDPTLINKVINLYRPYGESLVGVLTTGLPRVKYFPDDADQDADIEASKAYSTVEKKIADDNFMNIKLMEILTRMWNGGFAAAYNYTHTDPKNGIFEEEQYEPRPFEQESFICTMCGEESFGDEREAITSTEEDDSKGTKKTLKEQLAPDYPDTSPNTCPNCGITPHINSMVPTGMQDVMTGINEIPKSKQIIEIWGPLNIKIPALATKEEDVIWLIKEEEKHIAQAKTMFPDHKDKIEPCASGDLEIDRISRVGYEIDQTTLQNYPTIRWVWLRPDAYEILEDEEKVAKLKELYPSGVKAIFCNEVFLEAEEEDIDEHWTLSLNPLYRRIQSDPLGKALVGLDETANDLFQLEVDTVRYAIPEFFADPKYLDFKAREQSRALPGNITPMKRPPGGRLEDNLASTKTATIPKEVENLDLKIEKLLQFISGVLPSVFGGPAAGSKTLGEYQESKNQALQRLSIIWKVVSVMYAKLMAKATKRYVDDLLEDEKFVQEQGQGNFVNVWIKRSSFEGKIGNVRPELTEQFPSTWGQISARVMELLGMNNQVITSWFLHPENVELIYKVLGIDELYVPGEDQRNKQLYEISQLILSAPIQGQNPVTGEVTMQSSIPIESIDDNQIHMAVVQAYLNSTMGIELKKTNQVAYQNVMLHYQEHMMMYQQQMMSAQPPQDQGSEENVQEA